MLSTLSHLPVFPTFFPAMGLPLSHGKPLTAHWPLIVRSLTAHWPLWKTALTAILEWEKEGWRWVITFLLLEKRSMRFSQRSKSGQRAVNERSMIFHDSTEDPWLERNLEILAKVTEYLTCKLIHTCKQRCTIKIFKRHPRITHPSYKRDQH